MDITDVILDVFDYIKDARDHNLARCVYKNWLCQSPDDQEFIQSFLRKRGYQCSVRTGEKDGTSYDLVISW